MFEYLYENNKDRLSAAAINYFGNRISYAVLFAEIEKTARGFLALGVQPGEAVTVAALSCMPSVACLYGLNRIGAVSNYVNVLASEEELTAYMMDSRSRIAVCLDLFGEKVLAAAKKAGVEKVVFFTLTEFMPPLSRIGLTIKTARMDRSFLRDPISIDWKSFLRKGRDVELQDRTCPDDVCFYGHTGGTTGFPKTVLLQNKAFNFVAHSYNMCFERQTGDPFLNTIVPFVTYGTMINLHMPLCLGLETVLLPKFDPANWPKYIKKYHIRHLGAIPAYVEPIPEKLAGMDLSCLTTVAMGGEGMTIALEEKLNSFLQKHGSAARVIKGYGMTEVCATAVTGFPYANKVGSVGIPLVSNCVMIYDNESQTELPYHKVGEICMQCVSEMAGYKDNKTEPESLFRIHPDGSRWIHTGDLGYMDEDGFLFVEGRMKRMIVVVRDGIAYKVFPEQIEAELSRSGLVNGICVVGDEDGSDRVLRAFVIPGQTGDRPEATIEKELREYSEANLSRYTRPRFFTFCSAFPRTPAGKVDYRELEKQAQELKRAAN